ncbi:MAG: TrmH family RNA methyltransferase, partial [Gemmatimonadota bacterium]
MEDLLASDLALLWVACSSTLGDSDRGSALLTALREREVPTRVLSERDFAPLALTESPQGILAVVGIPSVRLEDIDLNSAPAVVLMLDAVQDPGNFGTLTRSAEALGAACVVALGGTVDPWNPKAVRSAAGSSLRLPVVQSDWTAASEYLRD